MNSGFRNHRNSVLPELRGTPGSKSHLNSGFQDSPELRAPKVTRNSVFPESHGTRGSRVTRNSGFTNSVPGFTRNSGFRYSLRTPVSRSHPRSSRWLREPVFPGEFENPEFRFLACLPACLLAYYLTFLLTFLLTYLLTILLADSLTYLLTYCNWFFTQFQ